jgi:hypothetical protein
MPILRAVRLPKTVPYWRFKEEHKRRCDAEDRIRKLEKQLLETRSYHITHSDEELCTIAETV